MFDDQATNLTEIIFQQTQQLEELNRKIESLEMEVQELRSDIKKNDTPKESVSGISVLCSGIALTVIGFFMSDFYFPFLTLDLDWSSIEEPSFERVDGEPVEPFDFRSVPSYNPQKTTIVFDN